MARTCPRVADGAADSMESERAGHRGPGGHMCLGVLILALVLFAPPLSAEAQQAGKVYRIGILSAGPVAPRAHQWDAFRQGLLDLGYVEGRNLLLEVRAPKAEGGSHDELAADLVRLQVDIIVAATAPAILAAKRATSTIPIVMTTSTDAVAQGLVASLARPGGNVTGLSMLQADLSGKRLDLVREIVPGASRIALLLNPSSPNTAPQLRQTEAAARALGLQLVALEARPGEALDGIFRAGIKGRVDALVVITDFLFYGLRAQVAERPEASAAHRLRIRLVCGCGRAPHLRRERHRELPPRRHLRGSHSQRRQAG